MGGVIRERKRERERTGTQLHSDDDDAFGLCAVWKTLLFFFTIVLKFNRGSRLDVEIARGRRRTILTSATAWGLTNPTICKPLAQKCLNTSTNESTKDRRPYGGFALAGVKLDLSGSSLSQSWRLTGKLDGRERERERDCKEFARRVLVSNFQREREREKCTALQIASMRLALASVLPETLSRKQLCWNSLSKQRQ